MLLLALALFGQAAGSPAADDPVDRGDGYALYWTIGETPVRQGDFWVKEQEAIVETRLWPVALYTTDRPVTGAGGALLVPAGAQLLRVTADRFLACTQAKATAGLAKTKRVCLTDIDGDGTIDRSFVRGSGGTAWMALQGRFSEADLQPVSSVMLRELPVSEMVDAPYLSFHYQRILDGGLQMPITQEGGNMVRFHFKVGKDATGRRTWVTRECRAAGLPSFCTSALFPSHMVIAGLDLELLERRKEDIRMRMAAPFHDGRVRFVDTSYGYYATLTLFSPEVP